MIHFDDDKYIGLVDSLRDKYSSYPSTVTIETMCLCNAYCSFCPYTRLDRKGTTLPDYIINKIIDEVKFFPSELELNIVLARVNETFLDKRWYDIAMKFYNSRANIKFGFFSNGSTIDKDIILKLDSIPTVQYFNISLNYSVKDEFAANSRLSFDRIISNISLLHQLKSDGFFRHHVVISRVGTNDARDDEFISFVKNKFPLFGIKVAQEAVWLCDLHSKKERIANIVDLPCRQWFQVHILSDGREAFCCIDAEGQYSSGNIYSDSIIQMYNHPDKIKARKALSRNQIAMCRKCLMLP